MAVTQALSSVIWIEVGTYNMNTLDAEHTMLAEQIKHNKKYYEKVLPSQWGALWIAMFSWYAWTKWRTSHIRMGKIVMQQINSMGHLLTVLIVDLVAMKLMSPQCEPILGLNFYFIWKYLFSSPPNGIDSLTVHNDTYRNEHSSCVCYLTACVDNCP